MTLPSNKNLFDLFAVIKFRKSSTLGAVDEEDIQLWNSKLRTCYEDPLLNLSELPNDVGSKDNPLVLTYVLRPKYLVDIPAFANYWNKLYETDLPIDQDSARRIGRFFDDGGIVHRSNTIVSWNLYWRDCYWPLCEKYWNTSYKYVVFTGTPGIGKSVFRSFMVWWEVQKAKELKLSSVILMLKSPKETSSVHGAFIEKGVITSMFTLDYSELKVLYNELNRRKLRAYLHIDVSKGDLEDAGDELEDSVTYIYSSPQEKAWREKTKINGSVNFIPSWLNDELYDFYIKLGANFVLMNKLRFPLTPVMEGSNSSDLYQQLSSDSQEDRDTLQIANKPISELHPLVLLESKDEVRLTYDNHTYSTSYTNFKKVIDEEVDLYGPVPRYLFLDSESITNRRTDLDTALDNKETDRLLTKGVNDRAYHRMIDIVLKRGENQLYKRDTFAKIRYLGTLVQDLVVHKILTEMVDDLLTEILKNAYQIGSLDHKTIELIYLALLSRRMSFFNFWTVPNPEIKCPPFELSKVIGDIKEYIPFERMGSHDFNRFLENITNLDLVAGPLSSNYPVIDGVRHFRYKEVDGTEIYITALLQVTLSKKHYCDLENLEKLMNKVNNGISKISESNSTKLNHRLEYWWIGPNMKEGMPSPSSNVAKLGLCERLVTLKPKDEWRSMDQ